SAEASRRTRTGRSTSRRVPPPSTGRMRPRRRRRAASSEAEVDERVARVDGRDADGKDRCNGRRPDDPEGAEAPGALLGRRPDPNAGQDEVEDQMSGDLSETARAGHRRYGIADRGRRVQPEEHPAERDGDERDEHGENARRTDP